MPEHFIRKQTLTNAERYIAATLKEKETIILNAKEEQSKMKKEYDSLVNLVDQHVHLIRAFADIIADIDAIQSLAFVAIKHQLSCPNINANQSNELMIRGLWHPMVAEHQQSSFIKNNIELTKDQPFMLITGPNMAGKSTVMKFSYLLSLWGKWVAMCLLN